MSTSLLCTLVRNKFFRCEYVLSKPEKASTIFFVILHCFWSFKRMEKENQAWGNSRMFSSQWETKTENVSVYSAVEHTLEHGSAQLAHYKKSDREAIKVQYYYTYVTRSLCDIMHAHGVFFYSPPWCMPCNLYAQMHI